MLIPTVYVSPNYTIFRTHYYYCILFRAGPFITHPAQTIADAPVGVHGPEQVPVGILERVSSPGGFLHGLALQSLEELPGPQRGRLVVGRGRRGRQSGRGWRPQERALVILRGALIVVRIWAAAVPDTQQMRLQECSVPGTTRNVLLLWTLNQ